jgi:transposase-like protein
MPVVILRLPEYETTPTGRPEMCPYCSSEILQSWGTSVKNLQDVQLGYTEVHRFRCSNCERTFRHYPQGVDRSIQSQRLRKVAALAWVIGLSSRHVVQKFKLLGIELSRMTVWREGREFARQLQERNAQDIARIYTLDCEYMHGISSRFGVVLVLDAGRGKQVVLGTLDEYNPRQVKKWLEQLTRDIDYQLTIVGTDFLSPPPSRTADSTGSIA